MAIGGLVVMSDLIDITQWESSVSKDICLFLCGGLFVIFAFCDSVVGCHYGYAFLGVITIWLLYDKIAKGRMFCSKYQWLATACGFTFFIYLVHEPLLLIFKKLPLLVTSGEVVLGLCFLFVPLVFIVTTIYLGRVLKKWIPTVLSLYMGGR
jgi:hypothetical protein